MIYQHTTDDIQVSVEPRYLPDESRPEESYFVWAYKVRIDNCGSETVQLESRYWEIMDMQGKINHVSGRGVVGREPLLSPGESVVYQSGVPLGTPSGSMGGHYVMRRDDGSMFRVTIPTFSLDLPDSRGALH